jgi:hypothetical protein
VSGPETQLVRRIRTALLIEYPGAVLWKIHGGPMQAAGIPDLVGCIDGRFVGLEVKLPQGQHGVSKIQAATLRSIRRAGGVGEVVTSPEEALEAVSPWPTLPI